MTLGGEVALAESDDDVRDGLDDFPIPNIMKRSKLVADNVNHKRNKDFNSRNDQSVSQPSDADYDAGV